MVVLEEILKQAAKAKASDIHLHAGSPPMFRIDTEVLPAQLPALNAEAVAGLAKYMMGEPRWTDFQHKRDLDFSFERCSARLRVNAHYQRNTIALAVRLIDEQVRPLHTLGLPEVCMRLTQCTKGLVLVTGGTGSGKSTTLAAMVDAINKRDAGHIVTLEDPVEFRFTNDRCAIEQREVGTDTPTFASGLKHVLRQDPDTILVGEMRDLETISAALTAAETGHLILSTLHTINAPQTIERIIDVYPAGQQNQVRSMLANALQAVVAQKLFKRAGAPGMVPAVEVMLCTTAVRNCIRENRIVELANIIETNRAIGMQSMDTSIRHLLQHGLITREDAIAHASQPDRMGLAA